MTASACTFTYALWFVVLERLSRRVVFGDYVPPVGGTVKLHQLKPDTGSLSIAEWLTGDEGEELLRVL